MIMEINNDLNLLVSFAIAYIAENCELSDESFSKLQGLLNFNTKEIYEQSQQN